MRLMSRERHRIAVAVAAYLAITPAHSQTQCVPIDNAARILSSASPNDIHPDWRGGSYVGTSWYFVPHGSTEDGTGFYLRGNLFSPRGGLVNADVYILATEWDCE
jgi:hypothetical protein